MSSGGSGDRRLGIVGAGKMGTTIARAAIAAGYDVAISGSGPADRIALTIDVLAPGARAVSTHEVVRHADIIVLAVPTHRFRELQRDLFTGKILIDAMNYREPIDGNDEELADAPTGSSVVVRAVPNGTSSQESQPARLPRVRSRPASAWCAGPRCPRRRRRRPRRGPRRDPAHRSTRLRRCRCRATQSRPEPRARRIRVSSASPRCLWSVEFLTRFLTDDRGRRDCSSRTASEQAFRGGR